MRYFIRNAAVLGLSLLAFGSVIQADDLQELKRKIVAAKEEVAELRDLGKTEEAEATEREVDDLMRAAKRLYEGQQSPDVKVKQKKEQGQGHPEILQLKKRLHELHSAMKKAEARDASEDERHELREDIGRVERELAEVSKHLAQHPRQEVPPQLRELSEKIEMTAQRIQHVRVAAENLKAAEMHDLAHGLMEKADAMEREVHAAEAELANELRSMKEHRDPAGQEEIQELRSENKRLQRELFELRKAVEELRQERKRE